MSKYTVKCIGYGDDIFLKNINGNQNPLMSNLTWIKNVNECEGISFNTAIELTTSLNNNI